MRGLCLAVDRKTDYGDEENTIINIPVYTREYTYVYKNIKINRILVNKAKVQKIIFYFFQV